MMQNQQQQLMRNIEIETSMWVFLQVSSSRGTFCEFDYEYSTQFTFDVKLDFFIFFLS